ncbi:uncharacterized protein MELLADRAFT_105167 [Melampsora larici-populina 98AG31]|uniref:Uncharacterized protein n=1 Tax=Melampsora larici-populina (strain 98AG31 / pathotype 3-4-7) TaxID=747676 RepID=F4RGU6_MELLP|nr:uncharacterized protein MELLADRAFT_105167 [Melampsora larici-populina 98AG31]EGG08202.1 hypothetical protein MELLADRAFT_105167 [Melampsora larici-populina 98AG31]
MNQTILRLKTWIQQKCQRDEIEKLSGEAYCKNYDDKWDSDSESLEPEKGPIHMSQTPFNKCTSLCGLAVCGALYFAPLKSAYLEDGKPHSDEAPEIEQLSELSEIEQSHEESGMTQSTKIEQPSDTEHCTAWPKWSKAHSTPYTTIPGFKTISSPKSLYCVANSP